MASSSSTRMECDEECSSENAEFCKDFANTSEFAAGNLLLLDVNETTPSSYVPLSKVEEPSSDTEKAECADTSVDAKRKAARELFPLGDHKASRLELLDTKGKAVVTSSPSFATLPKLLISQILKTSLRFAFEGKALNVYGTFDSSKEFVKKYLRSDLVDEVGFGTITLVVGPAFVEKFKSIVEVDSFLRVEGAVVTAKTPFDGGSVEYSLEVDATTSIIKAEPFEATVFFIPEISIQKFLLKSATSAYLKGTLAFVIVQVDKVEKSEGGTFEQLTIADGPLPQDRATLTFVNKRKALYHQLVENFNKGNIVPYVARNIGVWKTKSNTLSVLDITLVTPLHGERLKAKLFEAFNKQIKDLGFGKEIYGALEFTNFNGTLVLKKCSICKGTRVNLLQEGGYCFSCVKPVSIFESLHLEAKVLQPAGSSIEVSVCGDLVDRLLQLKVSALQLYYKDINKFRITLSEVVVTGSFFVNNQGQIIGFTPAGAIPK